jgi:eukaryotic-like serine/threonine-protein kinase
MSWQTGREGLAVELSREDILFAIIAAQMELANPTQLASAVVNRSKDSSGSLADQLVAAGLLTTAERQRVETDLKVKLSDHCQTITSQVEVLDKLVPAEEGTVDLGGKPAPASSADPREDVLQTSNPDVDAALSAGYRYQVSGIHAKGGQGQILLAFDPEIGREIAIKEFFEHRDAGHTPGDSTPEMERFLREAQVTGQLEHPNIVPVYELSKKEDGSFYYTMRMVHGQTLTERLMASKNLPDRMKLLGAFWDLCNAIAYAHSRGVVHRDIKPSNVMVNEFGQTVVLDWGVAKVKGRPDLATKEMLQVSGSSLETSLGTAIGTPSYMSPEQARGDTDSIDERSDVWSLGAVLYGILAGRRPFRGSNTEETMRMVREEELTPVLQIESNAPPELSAVAEKCLRKQSTERYQSAQDLAAEVDAFMTGGRVRADHYSAWELLKRFAGQHKAAFAASLLVLVVVVTALVVVSIALQAESVALQREHSEQLKANTRLAQAYLEKADRLQDELDFPAANLFTAASLAQNPAHPGSPFYVPGFASENPQSREFWMEAASAMYRMRFKPGLKLERVFKAEDVPVRIKYSRDGKLLVVPNRAGHIEIFNPDTNRLEKVLKGHQRKVTGIVFLRDGRRMISCSNDSKVIIWDLQSGQSLRKFKGGLDQDLAIALTPDESLVAVAGLDGFLHILELKTGKIVHSLTRNAKHVWDVDFSPDGRHLASAGSDGKVAIWNVSDGRLVRELSANKVGVWTVRYSPDGQLLASGGLDGRIHLWNGARASRVRLLEGHANVVHALAFSSDGTRLVSGSADATIRVWNVKTGKSLLNVLAHEEVVAGVALSPDGKHMASCGREKTIKEWKLVPARQQTALEGHAKRVYQVAFSADGRRLASSCWEQMVIIWERVQAGAQPVWRELHRFRADDKGVSDLDFSPNGQWLATAGGDKTYRVWNVQTGQSEQVVHGHSRAVKCTVYSPDGRILATCSKDRTIKLWNAESWSHIRTLEGHTDDVLALVFTEDGKRLFSASYDGSVRVWDPEDGRELQRLDGHSDWVTGLDVSSDGRWIASSGKDKLAIIWDAATYKEVARLEGHKRWINSIRFSPDGGLVATASDDQTVRIWSTKTSEALLSLRSTHEVNAVEFSPDGKTLVIGEGNNVAFYPLDFSDMDADPVQRLSEAEQAVGRRVDGSWIKPQDIKSE